MESSRAWIYVADCLQRKDINKVRAAFEVYLKILSNGEDKITLIQFAFNFLRHLKQIFNFSAKTGLVMTCDYFNKPRQLVYSCRGNDNALVFRGYLGTEPFYHPETYHLNYVGTSQPRPFGNAYPVALHSPRQIHLAAFNPHGIRMIKDISGNTTKTKVKSRSPNYRRKKELGYQGRLEVTKTDFAKNDRVDTDASISTKKLSKRQTFAHSALQPNKSARCENWPIITQNFWPFKRSGVRDLIRKHGPINTWYASSERPAPPASALPTPSFVLRKKAHPVATVTSSDSKIFSIDESGTSTDLTSECSASDFDGE